MSAHRDSLALSGTIELRHAERPHPRAGTVTDVGFTVHPDARGRGVATRAVPGRSGPDAPVAEPLSPPRGRSRLA